MAIPPHDVTSTVIHIVCQFFLFCLVEIMYCSPTGASIYKQDKTCFTREALIRLVEAWNETNPSQEICSYKNATKMKLWSELRNRMSHICLGDGMEACWVDNLQGTRPSKEIAKSLRPLKPSTWRTNEYTWLTNYDIENVMAQYDIAQDPNFKYKFLGVFPIDFEKKTMFGQCLFEEFCSLDIVKLYKKGVRFVGMITNLDKHDQRGSHWTSLFMCIDPTLPSFGAYYYDSVGSVPPDEISAFIHNVKRQVAEIPGADVTRFNIDYNKIRHQRGNTECGVFSLTFQIRWLMQLQLNERVTFDKIVNKKEMNDASVHQLRDHFFRPFQKKVA